MFVEYLFFTDFFATDKNWTQEETDKTDKATTNTNRNPCTNHEYSSAPKIDSTITADKNANEKAFFHAYLSYLNSSTPI